jgi:NAD(P)-dependent dehydrogenase (short-subunit alcohol dehydrogenase family)
VARRLHDWLAAQGPQAFAAVNLINNAGVISELAPLGDVGDADLANAVRVGLEAPMRLTAAFLRATRGWAVPRKVVLVSSGLGRRAMAGSASYCAAKAGLDHLARALALEEAARPERRAHRLAGARRDRHRHAGAAAQRRRAGLPRARALHRPAGRRPARQPGRRPLPGSSTTSTAPISAANPVADVRDA